METEGHPGLEDLLARMDQEKAWEYEQKAKQILSQLKIRNFDQQVKQLSGGQLKRVALANALITEPDSRKKITTNRSRNFPEARKPVWHLERCFSPSRISFFWMSLPTIWTWT